MLPYIVPARPPTRSWPVIVELSPTFWIVAPLAYPKKTDIVHRGAVDIQAADGVAKAVEDTGKGVARVPTAGSPRRCTILSCTGIDVVSQNIPFAEHTRAAHALHAIDVGQLIRKSIPSPLRARMNFPLVILKSFTVRPGSEEDT